MTEDHCDICDKAERVRVAIVNDYKICRDCVEDALEQFVEAAPPKPNPPSDQKLLAAPYESPRNLTNVTIHHFYPKGEEDQHRLDGFNCQCGASAQDVGGHLMMIHRSGNGIGWIEAAFKKGYLQTPVEQEYDEYDD